MAIAIKEWKSLFVHIAARIEEKKEELSELDRAVGDGDHGVTMSLGWQAILETIDKYDSPNCGALCKEMAMSFLNAVGSSVGPLYATAFIRGSTALQDKELLDEEDIVRFWMAAVLGIQERGKAKVGDKTMLDTWLPAMEALESAWGANKSLTASLDEAVQTGKAGMQSTAQLVSQVGRSSRLGERSVGHLDPGAVSAYYIIDAFAAQWKRIAADSRA